MGDLVNITSNIPAELKNVFDAEALAGDLSDGASSGGFAAVSFRGSKWRIAYGGETQPILNSDEEPVPSLEAVIVKASKDVSKLFYAKQYEEGDDEAPDCWSVDGKTPDIESTNKQCETCAACPNNVWGSKISGAGKKTKACSDNRRVVVVPLGDISNVDHGGAMLLRVPAASLADLAQYGKGMSAKGFPYNAIGTRIGFDINASYPKLTFKPIRQLTQDEMLEVAEVFNSDTLHNILSSTPVAAAAPAPVKVPEPAVSLEFEDTPVEKPKVVAKKKAAVKKKVVAKKAEVEADSDLDDLLADLDSLA